MQISPTAAAPRPAGPPQGTDVARIVFDGMPGEGVYRLAKSTPLAPGTSWSSLDDAKRAVAELTSAEGATAAGIFRRDGRFEAYNLTVNSGDGKYWANENDNITRTRAGHGLVAIVNGAENPGFMSWNDFRRVERYAGGE